MFAEQVPMSACGGSLKNLKDLKGYLAHKETPTPQGPPSTLDIGLQQSPRGVRFLVREIPL